MATEESGYYVLAADKAIGPFSTQAIADSAAVLMTGALPPALAFDKSSTRSETIDGHLRVEDNCISKACVSPYMGKEIPGYEELGLDSEKIYNLLRDPDELAKGAATFRGVPLLIEHIPVSATDHPHKEVVGTLGTDIVFDAPYLKGPLVIWTQEGRDAVDEGKQKELSAGYHYRPDMTPGKWQGEDYDGVMRDIVGNHVALVEKGRAGPDVVVGDQALRMPLYKETDIMAKAKVVATVKLPSRTALRLGSAIAVGLSPLIAQDKQLDLTKIMANVTAKNFKEQKKGLVKIVMDAAAPVLDPAAVAGAPAGAGPDDVIMRVLDMVENQVAGAPAPELEADEMVLDPSAAAPPAGAGETDPALAAPKKGKDAVMEFLKGKGMSEDDLGAVGGMFEPEAEDEELDEDGNPKKKEQAVDKKAMDAAIDAAVTTSEARLRGEFKATEEARSFVRPYVGDVAIAHDSAEKVLRAAAGSLKIKGADKLHVDALRPIIEMHAKVGERPSNQTNHIAQDSVPADRQADLAARFKGAARIGLNG